MAHGRWSDFLIGHAGLLVICGIASNCLDACRQRLAGRGAAPDHLVGASCLEGEYLKCIIARVA